jgi:hypothetical protein
MDLEKVGRKLSEGAYRNREDFKYDINKIFENARLYNQEETIYYKYANQLQGYVRPMLERLKEPSHDGAEGIRRARNSQQDLEMDDSGEMHQNPKASVGRPNRTSK